MKLFLDDERFPPAGPGWWIVRSTEDAIKYMVQNGCPSFISFDHDLGDGKLTGADLSRWMVEQDLDSDGQFIPADFSYYVHSQNPVGAANITGWLDGYLGQR
jgi:hypothetical protein